MNVMIAMSTQWRTAGMAGLRVGLDYGALPAVLRMTGVPRKEWPELLTSIRIIEEAAMETIMRYRK